MNFSTSSVLGFEEDFLNWSSILRGYNILTTTHYPYVMSCPLPTMMMMGELSKNNTTLILCPNLTPCPILANDGWTLHINFQRPLHVPACCHDGLLGAGCAPLAIHQVPMPYSNPLSFFLEIFWKSEPKGSRDCTTLGRPNYGSLGKFSPTLQFTVSSPRSFSWALSWVNTAPLCRLACFVFLCLATWYHCTSKI